jgi:hypothetical protein
MDNAVSGGNFFSRIAQQGIVDPERLSEDLVRFWRVNADRKVRDVISP